MATQPLSPRGAIAFGLVIGAMGAAVLAGGLGAFPLSPSPDVRDARWVIVCVGLMFMFAGAIVIVDYAVGRLGADGQMPPDTPWSIRLVQYLLGLGIIAMMTAVFTWIAFGSGTRQFSTTVSMPFWSSSRASSETFGRAVVGFGAVMMWLFLIAAGISGARQLVRDYRAR
jgi:hypothetical protein